VVDLKNHKASANTKKERGKKRKRKRMVVGVKPVSIRMPHFHGENIEKNQKPPRYDNFSHWYQPHMLSKHDEVPETLMLAQHMLAYFLKYFLFIKILNCPHPNSLITKLEVG
jgi:hypothetical protein